MKAGDGDKLGGILADDWAGLGFDGKKSTKQSLLADLKSGAHQWKRYQRQMGLDGCLREPRGKWVAVRSQSAMVK